MVLLIAPGFKVEVYTPGGLGLTVIVPSFAVGQEVLVTAAVPTKLPTVTVVVDVHSLPVGVVAVTVYTYVPGIDGAVIPVGFCWVELKQLRPVHK